MAISALEDQFTPAAVVAGVRAEVGELVETVEELQTLRSELAAVEAQVLAEVDARQIAKQDLGWGSTAVWFTHLAGLRRGQGRRQVEHARQLTGDRPATMAALRAGAISPEQAGVVLDALEALPTSAHQIRDDAEALLVQEAGRLNATDLATAARHLIEVVDPERAERELEKKLDRQDRAAHLHRFLSITEDGAGGVRLKGRGTVEDAAALRAALLPLSAPVPAADPETCEQLPDPRDHGTRMWDALVGIAQHALTTDLPPECHGARPRIGVTVPLDVLRRGLAEHGVTDDGLELGPAAIRRLACDADLIPVALGTKGEILDVGRTERLVTAALWRALVARDRHCAFPGCTRPPVMGHAHHIVHWADGGPTSLANLVLLCGHHHRTIHHTPWLVRLDDTYGRPEFLPPPKPGRESRWIRHRPRRE